MLLLDTHIWLWWLLGDGSLSTSEREELERLASQKSLAISWVTIWETEMLERKGRVSLSPGLQPWIEVATHPDIVTVLPADTAVVLAQRNLPDTFHGDPADRLIVATSVLSGYPLVTHDQRIVNSRVCKVWSA